MTTKLKKAERLNGLHLAAVAQRERGLQEFEILDYSTTWDGLFTFSRFGKADFITVELSPGDIAAAAQLAGEIECYFEKGEEIDIILDWDTPSIRFSDWYGDSITEKIISLAVFEEVQTKNTKYILLLSEINETFKESKPSEIAA